MVRSLLIRGMLVGILAGLLAFGFARVFGEPQVDLAIAFEEGHSHAAQAAPAAGGMAMQHAAGEQPEEELVSRDVQGSYGLLTGAVLYGAALGGLFALAFAFAQGRLGPLSPRATAGLIALGGFTAIVLMPQLKYPANPPAVGDAQTIGPRTALYFAMMAVSVLALVAAAGTAGRLTLRFGRWNATLLAAAAYVAAVSLAMLVLPAVDEVPPGFSAALLWKFRLASLGMHAVLWATLGIAFGIAADRLMIPPRRVLAA
ncbi:CbtA family protein [Labrys monachus]|uniref:MFS family permease n=1 Tax=Labrys monachus TaxID=217067 RepID=A0ABU0FNY1_9HYPH|nr:CbtA family protein [Labrys monachus]MDQ0396325.1 MFS family permease [Labrys monachus]